MATLSSIAKRLASLATEHEDATLRALAAALRDFEGRLTTALAANETWSYANLAEGEGMVERALLDAGLPDLADQFSVAARQYAQGVQKFPDVNFGPNEANALKSALAAKHDKWMDGVLSKPAEFLRDRLAQATVTPIPTEQLASELLDYLDGKYKAYADTYVSAAYKAQLADTWQVAGRQMGSDLWQLDGPNDSRVSHELCLNHLGEIKTLEEWEAIGNGTGYPVAVMGCGWNGRHILVPVAGGQE